MLVSLTPHMPSVLTLHPLGLCFCFPLTLEAFKCPPLLTLAVEILFIFLFSLSTEVKFSSTLILPWGFPSGSAVKNLPAIQETQGFDPQVGKIPWRRKLQPTPVPGKSHGQKSVMGCSP